MQAWAQIDGIDPSWAPNWAPTAGGTGSAQNLAKSHRPEIYLGPEHSLLEDKEAIAIGGEVLTDVLVHELTGSLGEGLAAGVAAHLLIERYYQPPSAVFLSYLRISGVLGPYTWPLAGGARLSDYERVYDFISP